MPSATAYTSNPTVQIDGTTDAGLGLDLQTLLVEETAEGLYRCEARFNNYGPRGGKMDYLYLDRSRLDFGKAFAVEIGMPQATRKVFDGRIGGIEAEYSQEGGAQVTILAEDRLQDLRMTRRTRTFEDMADADIIRQIASAYSLTPQLSLDGPTHKAVAQVNQSDLAFIRERARSCGAELWVEGATLHATARADRAGGTVQLAYGVDLIAFSVRADLAHQCTELGVGGWDVAGKSAIEETADESVLSAELSGDTGGASALRQAFGERKDRVVHVVPLTSSEARTLAQARYRERARRFVTGSGLSDGNPAIRVGCTLTLSRLGNLFDGSYYVVRARHLFDLASGFRTEFDVERPGIGSA